MKLSPITLLALPLAATACFFAGRWTAVPSTPGTLSIPSSPISASDLAASYKKASHLPYYSEASERIRADIRFRIERADAAAIFLQIARKEKLEDGDTFIAETALKEIARRHGTEHAWELALQTHDEKSRIDFCCIVCKILQEQDPSAALQKLETLPDSPKKNAATNDAIRALATTDPQRAIALALTAKRDERHTDIVRDVFLQLTRQDPAQAQAALANLDAASRIRAVDGIVAALRDTDPSAAWQVLSMSGVPVETEHGSTHRRLLQEWVKQDPNAAIAALNGVRESNVKAELFGGLVASWGARNFDDALDYMLRIDDPNLSAKGLLALTDYFTMRSPNADPERLFDAIIEKMPQGEDFRRALWPMATKWVRQDPQAAMQAVGELPPGEAQSNFAQSLISNSVGYTQSEELKTQVFDWIASLPEGRLRGDCLSTFFRSADQDDPQAALAKLAASPFSSEEQERARDNIISQWSLTDPKAVFQWATTQLPEGVERERKIQESIAYMGYYCSPAELFATFQSRPELLQTSSVRTFANALATLDGAAAQSWLRSLPDTTPSKLDAISDVCERLAPNDPRAAIAVASTMSSEHWRDSYIWSTVNLWMKYDPAAATAWIKQNNPKEMKNATEWSLPRR